MMETCPVGRNLWITGDSRLLWSPKSDSIVTNI